MRAESEPDRGEHHTEQVRVRSVVRDRADPQIGKVPSIERSGTKNSDANIAQLPARWV
jgi:hypothetical protein